MCLFKIIETRDLFLGRVTYGILAKRIEDGVTKESVVIPGISCDKLFVLQLIERFDRNQLSPIHMLDVVTDALS